MRVRHTAQLGLGTLALAAALGLAPPHSSGEPSSEPSAHSPATTAPPAARAERPITPVPIRDVRIDDAFWSPKRTVWRTVTVADCLDKFERDGAFTNFDKVRDGKGGAHGGPPWYDGLVYETITGAADLLAETPDPKLEARIDAYIARIAAAADKDPDGYINTHTQLKEPTHRWGTNGGDDREQHDLYNAACLAEAGVHYYRATGKAELLRVAARLASLMCDVMGPDPRRNIVPGHALGEMTLVELWALFREQPDLKKRLPFAVDEARYLALARFWVDQRGRHEGRKSFGAYGQDDKPIADQGTIEGHAVRATLFAAGLAALAPATDRDEYRQTAGRLWENMAGRRTYVTGGVGAVAHDEKFGADYDLPNDGYLETCAAVGAAFFHQRMLVDTGDARYADALERVLYNGALCGVSLSGDRYFYENPLEAGPGRVRWDWHPCPCCPPMFLKLMGSLPGLIYSAGGRDEVFVNLYVGSSARLTLGGRNVTLRQETRYPWDGKVRLTVDAPAEFALKLRVPGWCQGQPDPDALYAPAGRPAGGAFAVTVNGTVETPTVEDGYATVRRRWAKGDVVEVEMAMTPRRVAAHPKVAADTGRVALTRGPLVYCLEGTDHDGRVRNLSLPDDAVLEAEYRPDLLGGVTVLRAAGKARLVGDEAPHPAEVTAVPYFAHANRGPAALRVWVPRTAALATPAGLADAAVPSASHTNPSDSLAALNDGRTPSASDDESIPRFTWWDRRGTAEWVQYTFDRPTRLSAAAAYWWDERRVGRHCRVPASWRLVYRTAKGDWAPVAHPSAYGTALDAFNRVTFDPVETTALRLEAKLQAGWSGGLLEWQVDGPDVTIRVDGRATGHPVSKYLAGACIEDVNHEIYGGLYSQMIFGESFQEPPTRIPAKGLSAFGGDWRLAQGVMYGGAGDGPKLLATDIPAIADGAAGVEIYLPSVDSAEGRSGRNAGLILRVARPGVGSDNFDGYEIALDAGRKTIRVGRHQHDFALLEDVPYDVPTDRWVALSAKLTGGTIEVSLDGKSVATVADPRPLPAGIVGLRQWQREARYRNLWVETGGRRTQMPFAQDDLKPEQDVSGMWRPTTTGTAGLQAELVKADPFVGMQSQRITFTPGGSGEAGIENRGLNRRGMGFVGGKPYEGYLWLRTETPTEVAVAAETAAGRPLARTTLKVDGGGWRRHAFELTPSADESAGRFAVRLTAPGTVEVGHAFLQPGEWGRFQGLPVRKDVVEAMKGQGVTVLRYGGSMVNTPAYKWKNMVGPHDRRPPYRGHWYPHSSNGWGIPDFLDLCEAAGFLAIPDFNIDETPEDVGDFVEYANGPADSPWGRKRAEAGHPTPYRLRHLELGNEERIDAAYAAKFEKLALAIWAKDPEIILVVGDFMYDRPVTDPSKVSGAASRITSLDGHRRILELAKQAGREVWFDVHVWSDGPGVSPSSEALPSYIDALARLAPGARHRVAVFEFNANNHDQRRALANAALIGRLIRDGRVPVGLSANALQPDGQNDNGWDQGLLFLDPTKVWLQPPGYVTRMVAQNHLPRTADVAVEGDDGDLEATATRSEDGTQLALQVVNRSEQPIRARLRLDGLTPTGPSAVVEELAGKLDAKNTAGAATAIVPRRFQWEYGQPAGPAEYTFPPRSFTVIRFD